MEAFIRENLVDGAVISEDGILIDHKYLYRYNNIVGFFTVEKKTLFSKTYESIMITKSNSVKLSLPLDAMFKLPKEMRATGFYQKDGVIATFSIIKKRDYEFVLLPQIFLLSEASSFKEIDKIDILDKVFYTYTTRASDRDIIVSSTFDTWTSTLNKEEDIPTIDVQEIIPRNNDIECIDLDTLMNSIQLDIININ